MKNYLSIINIIYVLIFLFWGFSLSCCATTSLKSENKVLDYYQNTPHHENLYWGIGSGKNLKEASEESRLSISWQLYTKVYERIEKKHLIENNNGKSTSKETIEIVARLETETSLQNVKRLDYKTSIDGLVHVLSYLNNDIKIPFNEQDILDQINRKYYMIKNTKLAGSAILPGTGQLLDGEFFKGGMMLTGAVGSVIGMIFGTSGMSSNYSSYLSAENSSTQQYYFNQYEDFRLVTIISGVFYLISSAVSAIDYEANSF